MGAGLALSPDINLMITIAGYGYQLPNIEQNI